MARLSWSIANDSLYTDVCVRYPPCTCGDTTALCISTYSINKDQIAVACISLAAAHHDETRQLLSELDGWNDVFQTPDDVVHGMVQAQPMRRTGQSNTSQRFQMKSSRNTGRIMGVQRELRHVDALPAISMCAAGETNAMNIVTGILAAARYGRGPERPMTPRRS